MADEYYETSSDISSDIGSGITGDACSDFGGDLASDDGADLNEASNQNSGDDTNIDTGKGDNLEQDLNNAEPQNTENPTHRELVRGNLQEAFHAAGASANEIGQKPSPSSPLGVAAQLGEIGLSASKPIGLAAAHSLPAFVEGMIDLHGKSPAVEDNNRLISQVFDDDKTAGITGDPLKDNQDIIDAETGENLTDEKFRE